MDKRLTNVEIRLSYLEKTYGELDEVVRQLNGQMEVLVREVRRLRAAEHRESDDMPPNEKPPHY